VKQVWEFLRIWESHGTHYVKKDRTTESSHQTEDGKLNQNREDGCTICQLLAASKAGGSRQVKPTKSTQPIRFCDK
jgi:hypothetical protein